MDLFDAINQRASYRGAFADEPVSRDDLQAIVQAGIRAPSGCNGQTTSFVIVDDAETIRKIAEIVDNKVIAGAPAVVVCIIDTTPVIQDKSFAVEDCAAATENMLLAVTALGYATVWIDGVLRADDRAARIGRLLNVPEERIVRIVLPIGRPVKTPTQAEKKPFDQRASFNRWSLQDSSGD